MDTNYEQFQLQIQRAEATCIEKEFSFQANASKVASARLVVDGIGWLICVFNSVKGKV